MTHTAINSAESRIKNTIKQESLLKNVLKEISESIERDKAAVAMDEQDILGYIFQSSNGFGCNILLADTEDSAEAILKELIIYFSNENNLKGIPEELQKHVTNVLYHLLKTVVRAHQHGDLLFELVNAYKIKEWDKMTDEQKKEYQEWYTR
jgi:hypothetical protein